MAYKHCQKFQPAEQGAQTLQTRDKQTTEREMSDRQTSDLRRHIKNHEVRKIFLNI